jgi:peptidoglycan L-alanyl-D-glutamate endopeptidase CwlK
MRDKVSEQRVDELHPKVREDFRSFINEAEEALDITIRVTQGRRTFAEQEEIYSRGRTKFVDEHGNKLGIVTKAKPGQSFHQYDLAIDVVPIVNGKLDWNFSYWKLSAHAGNHGIEWGGTWKGFKDMPHFQKTLGYTWQQLLDKHNKKDFIPGTEYVNL